MSVNRPQIAISMHPLYGNADMPDLETRQLRLLAAIADSGNLTAAAARLRSPSPP